MTESSQTFPVLPLRDIVVFPHMVVPLFVGREKSVKALEEVMRSDKQILLAAQMDAGDDDPSVDAIYKTGVVASVLQLLKLPDGTVKVLVEGKERAEISEFRDTEAYFEAEALVVPETVSDASSIEALARAVRDAFEPYTKLNKNIPDEAVAAVAELEDPSVLADTVAGHLGAKISEKQELLETLDLEKRLEKIYGLMQGEISVLKVEKKIIFTSFRQLCFKETCRRRF